MILYHGTSYSNALNILKTGFDFEKSGSNWGNTYGKGIYFTPNYDTAKFYASSNGIILSMNININALYLEKDISPNSKKIKNIYKNINKNINCIVSPNKDEYLILYFQ